MMRRLVMQRGKQPRRGLLRDFVRLARADDLLSRLGGVMMRTSPKATIWTAGITSSGYLSNRLGLPGFTGVEALMAPIVVGGGLLGLGLAMRFAPAVLSAKWLTVAEASDLNLMEDYRKSQAPAHLNALWDKVFFYESAIRYSLQERQAERDEIQHLREYICRQIHTWDRDALQQLEIGSETDVDAAVTAVLSERVLSHIQEKSREGFIVSSLYGLRHPLPQCSQAHTTGLRLGLYEDLCDGAYFDKSDTKLTQQYVGNQLLRDIKKAVAFGKIDRLRQLPASLGAKLWWFLVTRRIATGLGRAVTYLNDKYGTDEFNSQVFLWPGQEAAPWLDKFPGATEEIVTLRRSVVRSALGNDFQAACAILDKMFLACFEFATDLRARYDPEYCDGSLDYTTDDTAERITNNLIDDLRARGYRPATIDTAIPYVSSVRREQSDFLEYLRATGYKPILESPLALRAVKIAFHTNYHGMKDVFRTRESEQRESLLKQEVHAAAADRDIYDRRIVGLRLHHQLTILLLDGYKDLARTLAY